MSGAVPPFNPASAGRATPLYGLKALALAGALLFFSISAAAENEVAPAGEEGQGAVFLLHGMGRTRASMWVLQHRLKEAGYTVHNFPYTTFSDSLDALSEKLIAFIREKHGGKRYHLIGHSLGNIIARNAFKTGYPEGLGRMVMLAPPNHPAELAKRFRKNPFYKLLTGDSGQMLSSEDFYATLPTPDSDFGVIAGDRGPRWLFKEANDGVVAVEATKLAGMADWLLLHHSHTFLMNSRDTAEHCIHFLEQGAFRRTTAQKASPPGGSETRGCPTAAE